MSAIPTNFVDNIGMFVNAAYLNNLGGVVNANTNAVPKSGAFSALPAAGNAGLLYACTDVGLLLRDNGTSWDRVSGGPLTGFTAPPSTGLSTVNLGTATFAANKDGRLLTQPSGSAESVAAEYSALSPASGYTATAYFESSFQPANSVYGGIILLDASNKMILFGPGYASSLGGAILLARKYTSPTAASANYLTPAASAIGSIPNWLRVRDDGTNRYFEYSFNGVDWVTAGSSLRTDFLTPTSIGWGGSNSQGASGATTALLRLRSWKMT